MNPTGQSHFNQARIEWAIRLRYSPMPELDLKYLASQLNAFRIGELRTVGKTWEVMMERDGELAVNADKRAADLARLDWEVVSDGSAAGDAHAHALTYFYQHLSATHALDQDATGGMSQLLYQMATAHSHYYSAHEILLRIDNAAAREVTAEFRHTPIWFFEARRGYLGYLQHIFDMYGQPCLEGEWLTVVGSGWMRPLCFAFAMKAFSLRDWGIYNARYASGVLEVISDAQKGEPAWDETMEVLRSLTNDGAVIHNRQVEAKFLAQEGNKGAAAFEPMVERIDRLYAKCYRGVDLATGSRAASPQGGNNPTGASVQKEESGIFLARDAAWAADYLQRRVDAPIIRYLFNQEPRAKITIKAPVDETVTEDLASAQILVPMGLRISQQEAYKRFRWTQPAPDEACLTAPVPTSPLPAAEGKGEGERIDNPPAPNASNNPPSPFPSPAGRGKAKTEAGQTQHAMSGPDNPIGAGAQLGAIQTASPNMPDPQVQAGSFWSQPGAFLDRLRQFWQAAPKPRQNTSDAPSPLPTLAVAVPNQNDAKSETNASRTEPDHFVNQTL